MCIIHGEVDKVADTHIYVGPAGTKQITVYANQVFTNGATMFLPVPSGPIQFVDLSSTPDMFAKMNLLFAEHDLAKETFCASCRSSRPVQVHTVGSYKCSILNTADDFFRLDPNVFGPPDPQLFAMMATSYMAYKFVACKMVKDVSDYHPLGYVHNRLPSGAYFIPTRHYHRHPKNQITNYTSVDWDHEIYCADSLITNMRDKLETVGVDVPSDSNNYGIPARSGKINKLYRYTINGTYDKFNHDFLAWPETVVA